MAKRCRQLCIVLFVTLWFIIAEGSFCKLVHAELLQEKSEESDFAEDMDEALSELDLSDLEQFVSDNLSKTHIGFGEIVSNLIQDFFAACQRPGPVLQNCPLLLRLLPLPGPAV